MEKMLKDKVAVVTGGGRGIGREIALALAAEGAKVVVNDVGTSIGGVGEDKSPANEVVDEIKAGGGQAVSSHDSVATMEGGARIIQKAMDTFARIDIVVNNAGIGRDKMLVNMSEEEWDAVIAVHLKGLFCVTRPAVAIMREQKSGRVINITSHAGLQGNMGQTNYSAAKAGVVGFTLTAALELAKYNVTINAIAPMAWTRMVAAIPGIKEPPGVNVKCVAPVAVYLASDAAQEITGQIIAVRGNKVALMSPAREVAAIYSEKEIWTPQQISDVFPAALKPWVTKPGIKVI